MAMLATKVKEYQNKTQNKTNWIKTYNKNNKKLGFSNYIYHK